MDSSTRFPELSECISRTVQEYFAKASVPWPHDVEHPTVRIEAFLEDDARHGKSSPCETLRIVSVCVTQSYPPEPRKGARLFRPYLVPTFGLTQGISAGLRDFLQIWS